MLAVVCKRMQQLPTMLGAAVHVVVERIQPISLCKLQGDHVWWACMAPTMLEELCKRIQHCCATLRRSRNKRNVGSCWLKSLTGFKLCATTCNNISTVCATCKRTQHVTSNNVGSCWPDMLFANVKLNSLLSEMCCLCESYQSKLMVQKECTPTMNTFC